MPPRDAASIVDPAQDITRREILRGAAALPLFFAGVSCGDDDDGDDDAAETVTLDDDFGTVEIPAKPQRVIAVRHHHVGNMLALGVKPIGIVPDITEFPFPGHAEALKGVANVRAETDWMLDIEKALALAPDLILEMSGQPGDPWNREVCELAKASAPTACFPYGYTYEDDIKQNMRDVGTVLGLSEKADEVIAGYDERVAGLKEKAAAAGFADKPVATIIWQGNGNFWVSVDGPANMIMRSLGIAQPGFQADPAGESGPWSFERLDQLNEAHAVVVMLEGDATEAELAASPVWRLIAPVSAGRAVFVDANLWGWDYMPALMHMLDDVEELVLPLAT